MRILWLSPWLRPLARVQLEALTRRGHEVLLVTSDRHPEADTVREYELVLDPRPKTARTWAALPDARARTKAFAADVVVAELVRDPRWLSFRRGAPMVTVVHDDRPHDASEQRPRWERALFDRWAATSATVVAHSRHVADRLGGGVPVEVVPLTSDLDDRLVPPPVSAQRRRDFVVVGRLGPYKNLGVTLAAWRAHVDGPDWTGDDLVLVGAGEVPDRLPPHVRRLDGPYRYDDVLPVLSRAKASITHYRRASQSGVQVLALQLGVTPVVSPLGGLPEYLPVGETAVGVDDVAALAARFAELADPDVAAARGVRARETYERQYAADVTSVAWEGVLEAARLRSASR